MESALSAVRFFAALRMTWGEGLAMTDETMLQLPSVEGMDSRLRGNDGVISLLGKHIPSPFRYTSLLWKQESRQYNWSTLVSQETLKRVRPVRRKGAC